jgi:DNA-binding transcriptional regulator YdaS (Cro superfamily)
VVLGLQVELVGKLALAESPLEQSVVEARQLPRLQGQSVEEAYPREQLEQAELAEAAS